MKTLLLVPAADCLTRSQISEISLRAVSAPRQKSVPGTLLLIVAGSTMIGIRNSGYLSRFCMSRRVEWYASNPPSIRMPLILWSRICCATSSNFPVGNVRFVPNLVPPMGAHPLTDPHVSVAGYDAVSDKRSDGCND